MALKSGGLLMAKLAALTLLAALACGTDVTLTAFTPTPVDEPLPTPSVLPPTSTPTPRPNGETALDKVLSSGLSVTDVVEKALPSIAHISSGSGSGTGFVIDETGLVVTNKHVVQGSSQVTLRLASGGQHRGRVTQRHPSLDLAYIEIDSNRSFIPIAIGDSSKIRVGEDVIAIGFPLGRSLGQEPTVSVGIISAKRNNRLQTDASLNPGNSGGPLLNMFGEAIGVVTSRVDSTSGGRAVAGISFAIPINEVKSGVGRQVSPSGQALPTPTPTPFSTIGPTPDVPATRATLQTIDAQRRQVEQATRTAIEAQQEAERYAASLEATRIAELPTATPVPTPTPEPTPTPTPTPTPHPSTYCEEWEAMVLEWIKQGNNANVNRYSNWLRDDVPDHPQLSSRVAGDHCLTRFPIGIYPDPGGIGNPIKVGFGAGELLPGTYEYRQENGNKRVEAHGCAILLNYEPFSGQTFDKDGVRLPYGEPYTIEISTHHEAIFYDAYPCQGSFYRIVD